MRFLTHTLGRRANNRLVIKNNSLRDSRDLRTISSHPHRGALKVLIALLSDPTGYTEGDALGFWW
jgi:hypothetical protein